MAAALQCKNLSKHYGGVTAVDDFTADLHSGEITALLGDNGAGKTTLVKMLAGAIQPDGGEILRDGRPVHLASPRKAKEAGIEVVWQSLAIARDLDCAANLFLGRELTYGVGSSRNVLWRLAPLRSRAMRDRSVEMLSDLGIDLKDKAEVPVGGLSGGQVQALAIARAVSWAGAILLLDEPTAALGARQGEMVQDLCVRLRDGGACMLLISHSIPEVMKIADRVIVLRHGRKIHDEPAGAASHSDLIALVAAR